MSAKKIAAAFGASALVATGVVSLGTTAANAVAINGGCSSFFTNANTGDINGTTGATYLGQPKGAWSDEASTSVVPDYTLTSSGSSAVGEDRNFSLTYDKGMLSFAPATGTQHWFFSVNGVMLPAVVETGISLQGGVVSPGDTVTGSYEIASSGTNNIVFEKMVFASDQGVRVVCSGQNDNTATSNPHATPVATNVSTSFNATKVAQADITDITNQSSNNHARPGDVISFEASQFTAAGTGNAKICTTAATPTCSATVDFAIDANGDGSGTITVPGNATFQPGGARQLVLSSGDGLEAGVDPFTLLGPVTMTSNVQAGGAGAVVTLNGTNFDTGAALSINSYSGAGQSSTANGTVKTVTTNADGTFSTTYTVEAEGTTSINAVHLYRMPVANGGTGTAAFIVPGSVAFAFSADSCTVGPKADLHPQPVHCDVLQNLAFDINGGDLSMSQSDGDPATADGEVALSDVQLDGTAKTSTGSINTVTVKDHRGGNLGWSLVGRFSGMDGDMGIDIPANALTWTPACDEVASSTNDTVTSGASASFANSTDALALCSVAIADNGGDGTTGGSFTADAGLSLAVPANQAAGGYAGTLTLTLS